MENRSVVARLGAGGRGEVVCLPKSVAGMLVMELPVPRLWWWVWEPTAAVPLRRVEVTRGPGQVKLGEAAEVM